MGRRDDVSPLPDDEVFAGGLRWVEASFMQAQRFEDVLYEFEQGMEAARTRRLSVEEGQELAAYGIRARKVPSVSLSMQVANELDLLVVSIRNVLRAVDRLDEDRAQMTGAETLKMLRNAQEHWDEEGYSARALKDLRPDHPTDIIRFTNKEIWIADVPLSRIRAWLARVNDALRARLADNGIAVPDLDASVVEGDDDLPGERLRYEYWSLPIVDEEHWPTEELPPGALEALALRFRNLRARDNTD